MPAVRAHSIGISLDAPFGHAGLRRTECGACPRRLLLGRGVRRWDGLEGFEDGYEVVSVTTPSGVTHRAFTRRVV